MKEFMEKELKKNGKENIKKTNQTWVLKNKEGLVINRTSYETGKEILSVYYGKLEEIVKLITLKEFNEMETLEVLNKGRDNRNHKPITKDEIKKILEEM